MTHLNNKSKTIEEISAATARTISTNRNLDVEIEESSKENKSLKKKNLIKISSEEASDLEVIRGKLDFFCFNERYTRQEVYLKYQPDRPSSLLIYELVHKARSHFLGISDYPGSFKNIKNYSNSKSFKLSDEVSVIKNDENPLSKQIYFFFLELFLKKKILTKSLKNSINADIIIKNVEDNNYLINNINHHQKFSKKVNEICEKLDEVSEKTNDLNDSNNNVENKSEPNEAENSKKKVKQKLIKKNLEKNKVKNKFSPKQAKSNQDGKGLASKINQINYKFYTNQYDLISNADKLSDEDERMELKKKLLKESPKLDFLVKKLAIKLQRKLLSKKKRSWEFDQEEGLLDTSRLTKIIIDPNNELTFKKEIESSAKNTVVSLLIDNSGSMRGKPIIIAANAIEVLTKTLERCGVKVEILGFTTKNWKGGNSRIDWIQKGQESNPGRLNDLLHIIYKDSNKNFKTCEKNIGLVLKDGLLKENIDGEALIWAQKRLLKKVEKKKILIVISDGAPVDDSTLSANNSNILEEHLSNVIKEIESKDKINLMAIGIGHDVSKYYKKAVTISEVEKLAEVMLKNLTNIFDETRANP